MKKFIWIITLLLLPCLVYSNETIDQRENYFQTSTPSKIIPKVNPITGDLIEEEVDLIVAGCEPLSARRFYNHTALYEPRTGGWRYNPETYLVANFEYSRQEKFAAAGEFNGSISSFNPSFSGVCSFDVPKGFSQFNPTGQTHPLNTKIHYRKVYTKEKGHFSWHGEVIDGSGAKRFFDSPKHCWLTNLLGVIRTKQNRRMTWTTPNVWTPYQLSVYEERKPNGNLICYYYVPWKACKYPRPSLLGRMTAYNADKTKKLGSIVFHYNQDKHGDVRGITIEGSDRRRAVYHHQGSTPILLDSCSTPDSPRLSYGYQKAWVNRVEKPEGRIMTTEYNQAGKVAAQYAPVGPNGEMHPIGRYIYHERHTEVYDAEGNKTIIRFNEHKQILSSETFQDEALYRIDRLTWDAATGNLLKKTIENGSGRALQISEYAYDKNHNPILEKIGDGKEWRAVHRTFSDDGFNLKLSETDRAGKLTRYRYNPNTNLLASELVYDKDRIARRTFHFYDECAICIQTIIDDGSTEDPDNLQGVTYRKIAQIVPKQTSPCFGLPEIVEEKTIDSTGHEILLSKIVYTYTRFGKVLQEDHYDAENVLRYSLFNEYDEKERLISTTDPLGNQTLFTYDPNNNLTSITGPRPDQYREFTYDKANRVIQISDRQTDGTVLTIEKNYDKLGRVIEETDACKNKTRFQYDAMGRVAATIYPDGAIEKKEYDVFGNIIKETDPEGYETKKTYNCFGQVVEINYPDGSTERFTYHSTGTIRSHQGRQGAATVYTYDLFDHPVKIETYSSSGALLNTKGSTWTPFCQLSETDEDLTIAYTYDYAGRKTGEQKAYEDVQYAYDALGRLSRIQNEETINIKDYDSCGRLIEVRIENAGIVQKREAYMYDASGNCTHTQTSQGITETFFNTDGKPLSIKDPCGNSTVFSYSHSEQFTKIATNPKNIQTIIHHDNRGREAVCLKKNTNGDTIQCAENFYNKNGNLIQTIHTIFSGVVPIQTIAHQWEYGPLERLERFIEAGEKETRYFYDNKGNLQTILKPSGQKIFHRYDDLGRLCRYHSLDFDYHFAYDARNRLISIFDALAGTYTFRTYDPLNNILEETLGNGLKVSNIYDKRSRRIKCRLPDNSSIAYAYKGMYLQMIERNHQKHIFSERNPEGQIIRALSPAGEIRITRDALGRCISLNAPLFSADRFQYDPVGNLLHYIYQDALGKTDCHFTYDDLDQLTQEERHSYQFDSLHNRLKKDTCSYTNNALCQVEEDGIKKYAYDPCGNLISDGEKTYVYDSLDRLIAVQGEGQKTEYTYDSFNRRLSKTIHQKGKNPHTVRYLWDGTHEIGSIDEQGHIQELRVLGEGLGAEIGAAVFYELNGKPYIPIHDYRGCVVTLIDQNAEKPVETYRYSAFGEEQTEGMLSPWRFSSKRVDPETSLVFFGKRYYNPELGRWITQDPLGFKDGPNLYAYLHNSPLTQIDLHGLHGIGKYLGSASRAAFRTLEWTGANLIPVPFIQGLVESVGRWGAGGDFLGPSRYRSEKNEIITIPGKIIPGHTYTHVNGMLNNRENGIEQAKYVSKTHGGVQVDLLYHRTNGLIMDLISSGLSKLGIPTSYNLMCANYYRRILREDPNHSFTSSVHSRGGIQIMNTGRLLSHSQRQHIDVIAYGSATLIPNKFFRNAENILSGFDFVTMTNPLAYGIGLMSSKQFNMRFLSTSTRCPVKAHGFLEATYAEEIARKGFDFKKEYFNE